ncbi:MAG: hypothetical protein JXA24_07450 [Proteobacteria bacterium]|nr:hypothetical protein [Pseudomonadota bacterium]
MSARAGRSLCPLIIPLILLAISVSAPAQDSPAKERCAPGYGYDRSRGECLACDQPCKSGLPGICGRGLAVCEGGQAACRPTVEPGERMEVCNGEDDNCDGRIDEGFDKDGDGYTTCMGDCNDRDPKIHPDAVERCDGVDNNCNGLIDDGFNVGGHCTAGLGECRRSGRIACTHDGSGAACDAAAGEPSREICDGLDNDCDGKVDEDLGELTCGVGACFRRVPACEGGKESQCVPGEPGPELCGDGVDNDCDGRADEGFEELGRTCHAGVGACRNSGVFVCSDDRLSLVCSARPGEPGVEICGNGIDDDCDGEIDADAPGLGEPCDNGQLGECAREGVMACDPKRGVAVCSAPRVEPRAELCDGLDNDCDGEVDNGVRNACGGCGALPGEPGAPCGVPGGDECARGVWACNPADPSKAFCKVDHALTERLPCAGDDNPCTVARCSAGLCRQEPVRNGIRCDDGDPCSLGDMCIDGACVGGSMISCEDGNPCTESFCDPIRGCVHTPVGQGAPNACGGCAALPDEPGARCSLPERSGPCSEGTYLCQPDGLMLCIQTFFGRAEECNGIDDDCDGETDEGLGTKECGIGVCRRVVDFCREGREAECVPGDPGVETCSNMGSDDDCNGVPDDVAGIGNACAVRVGTCVVPGKMGCVGDAQNLLCVPADPADAEDSDGDGVPNYCDREPGDPGRGEERPQGNVAGYSEGLFDEGRTRAGVLPWRQAFDSLVLNAASPDSALLLVSGATGDRAGFAVLRAKDASRQHFSFSPCEASVGERPRLLAAAETAGSVVAASDVGYIRYHKIASQIPSPEAKGPACRLYGERLDLPPMRSFNTKRGEVRCSVESVESLAVLGERPLIFAGAVKCRVSVGAAQARVSDVLGIDVVASDDARGVSHEFFPVLADSARVESAKIVAIGQGREARIFVALRADGRSQAGLCSRSQERGWACELSPAAEIRTGVVFASRLDGGKGKDEVLVVSRGGDASIAKVAGPGRGMALYSAGRAATATSGGAVEDVILIRDPSSGKGHLVLGRERSVSVAAMGRDAEGKIRIHPASAERLEPRSEADDVSPGGKFSFSRSHAMAALPLKGYGGTDLFVAFDMQKAGRSVGSMGFIYWNANEPPSGRIAEISFDGVRGRAGLAFSDPTGDRLKYRANIKAGHGGSLDRWIDRIEERWLHFSAKGDTSAVGLWPIEIVVEAEDPAGAIARSRAVMGRDGALESITETSENQ